MIHDKLAKLITVLTPTELRFSRLDKDVYIIVLGIDFSNTSYQAGAILDFKNRTLTPISPIAWNYAKPTKLHEAMSEVFNLRLIDTSTKQT